MGKKGQPSRVTMVWTAAPAKINWTLEALARRPDGYHEIDTLFQTVSLADTLEVAVAPGRPGIEVSTDGGRSWRRLDDSDEVPQGTTHLRWQIGGGEGRLSYRAVVR